MSSMFVMKTNTERGKSMNGTHNTMMLNAKKQRRAKYACRNCNARRIRCDLTDTQPCSNCKASEASCVVFQSQRGRRRTLREKVNTEICTGSIQRTSDNSPLRFSLSDKYDQESSTLSEVSLQIATGTDEERDSACIPAILPTSPRTNGSVFYGESNFLTLVPKSSHAQHGDLTTDDPVTTGEGVVFALQDTTKPKPAGAIDGIEPSVSPRTLQYLVDEGALELPSLTSCIPALQAYFNWFHPCFPIIDRADFTRKFVASDISPLLLQSMLFIGATYCDDDAIVSMGFPSRVEAKSLLHRRAKSLYHSDWEKDKVLLIQCSFLMSFWRGGPTDVRDVRYWLGIAIGVAESIGLHRSTKLVTKNLQTSRLRRRIWWSIYVREQQAAASLGFPSRIRDIDCDIGMLTSHDLLTGPDSKPDGFFGVCKPDHVAYALNMVKLVKILAQVMDDRFSPGRYNAPLKQVKTYADALESWRNSLPKEVTDDTEQKVSSVWKCLLDLAYNHLKILIHKDELLKQKADNATKLTIVAAASQISRIAEDMLAEGLARYGQMHLITSFSSALCIHSIAAKGDLGVPQRIAIHRARICLLGLKEVQTYWSINNNMLEMFFQHLDVSISRWLHDEAMDSGTTHQVGNKEQTSGPCARTLLSPPMFTDVALRTDSVAVEDLDSGTVPELWSAHDIGMEPELLSLPADLFNLDELDAFDLCS